MHTSLPHTIVSRGRRLATAAVAAISAFALFSTAALASSGSQYGSIGQYGEVTSFGGFDTSAYNAEKYGGTLTGGKFLNPVGFAVDTKDASAPDGTAIYVLDRVSDWGVYLQGTDTEWRLQKLSDSGAVLGTSVFELPNSGSSALGIYSPTGVVGLAVDDTTGAVYTILYTTVDSGNAATPEAEEIIGWSTTPSASKQLEAPAGAKLDAISQGAKVGGVTYTKPAVFSEASQLESTPLYNPEGLALDVSGSSEYLAIEADSKPRAANGAPQGPTIVQQVAPNGGADNDSWLSSDLQGLSNFSGPAEAEAVAAGISTAQDGSLDVLLEPTLGSSLLDAVDLPTDLDSSGAAILASSDIDPGNADASPLIVADSSGNRPSAGPQAIELSNDLYASDFYENTGGAGYFDQAANEGVRLVSIEADGLLANPIAPATSIFDTLGNDVSGGACHIGDGVSGLGANDVSLAAGSNGTIWALTSGLDSSAAPSGTSDGAYVTGRRVIELSPGAGKACVAPSGTFRLDKQGGSPQSANAPLTVPAGSTVDFDASTIEYPAGSGTQAGIYAYEWDPTGSGSFSTVSDALSIGGFQPTATASYQYTTPGVYEAKLTVLGDLGEYDASTTVTVQASSPPTAAFSLPSQAQTGQSVSLDASASQPASGAQIANYHWSFGDGQSDDTQSSSDAHVYATPGTYTVTLTVRDDDNQESTSVSHQITIVSPPVESTKTTTSTTQTSTTKTAGKKKASGKKPETEAQKLAAALKQCKKDKPKKKRAACEKQAKKKYAPKKKKTTKKKKK